VEFLIAWLSLCSFERLLYGHVLVDMVFGSGDPSEVQISSSGSADLSPNWVDSPPQTV